MNQSVTYSITKRELFIALILGSVHTALWTLLTWIFAGPTNRLILWGVLHGLLFALVSISIFFSRFLVWKPNRFLWILVNFCLWGALFGILLSYWSSWTATDWRGLAAFTGAVYGGIIGSVVGVIVGFLTHSIVQSASPTIQGMISSAALGSIIGTILSVLITSVYGDPVFILVFWSTGSIPGCIAGLMVSAFFPRRLMVGRSEGR